MKEQYQILAEIHKMEDKFYRLHNELERIPQEIKKIEAQLKAKEDEFKKLKGGFEENEKKQRSAELDLKEREELLKKAEAKMMDVKNNEEYQAAMKENEAQKKEKAKFEETVLSLIGKVEQERNLVKAAEQEFAEAKKKLAEEKSILEEERKKLAIHYEELGTKKNSSRSLLQPDIATVYDRISRKGTDPAIAMVEAGTCQNCNVRIQPQAYNEMLGYKKLHRCTSCGRILIHQRRSENT